jgi:hypothetical protein
MISMPKSSLLAEYSDVRRRDVEELRDHRAHALEMPGTEIAVQPQRDLGRRDVDLRRMRIHLLLVGREHDVAAGFPEQLHVALERARIAIEVAAGIELQAVHEDGRDDALAVPVRELHQREVSRVQVAHGGHERDRRLGLQPLAKLRDVMDDVH